MKWCVYRQKLYGFSIRYTDGSNVIELSALLRYTMLLDILLRKGTKEWGPRLSSTRNWIFSCRPDCEGGGGVLLYPPSARHVTQMSDNTAPLLHLPV